MVLQFFTMNMAKLLHVLTEPNARFEWTALGEHAFNNMKQALLDPLVLAFPDWEQVFRLTTDASDKALGSVLAQKHRYSLVTNACASRALQAADILYPTSGTKTLSNCLADQEVWGRHLRLRTDHDPRV